MGKRKSRNVGISRKKAKRGMKFSTFANLALIIGTIVYFVKKRDVFTSDGGKEGGFNDYY
jgi:hypothetical protein